VYDITGRELLHTNLEKQFESRLPVKFAVGTYLVKVTTEKGISGNKIFLN
jgi:hypothetical protein